LRRVVITGIGLISNIGIRLDEVGRSLREGRSGIGLDPSPRNGFIAGTPRLETPGGVSAALHLPVSSSAIGPRTVVKNSFGFGGTNSARALD
jgi:3-oxoacyl-(acyl-carrier-protein) synthase